ncbi:MAG: magnesium transporter MgtE N-terminal domain-containing protein [Gemmatimonadota bacterium]
MKIVIMGMVGLLLGTAVGAFVGGKKESARMLSELAAQQADSLARAAEAHGTGDASAPEPDAHATEADGGDPSPQVTDHGERSPDTGDPVIHEASDTSGEKGTPEPAPDGHATVRGSGDAPPGAQGPGGLAPAPVGAPGASPSPPTVDPAASKKLAKIFAAMKPVDAAAVLQEMSDSEVQAILMSMAERQAAQVLGKFEAERAAHLTAAVIMRKGDGG